MWWQTREPREAIIERTLALPFSANSDANLRSRERGLIKLLDWLEAQPGDTWQERWLASGVEEAGRDWKRVPLEWLAARDRARKYDTIDLSCGMIPLLGGQVLRPNYRWLLRLIPAQLLAQFRRATDPDGFAALQAHCEATGRHGVADRAQALNRITWIMIRKGGLIRDITIGDCVELQDAIGAHQCAGQHGKHFYYALLAETGVFGAGAPPRLKAVMVIGQLSPAELIDKHEIAFKPIRDLLVDYLTDRTVDVDYVTLEDMARSLGLLFWKDLEQHNPGISSLRLDAPTAAAWKERVSVVPARGRNPARPRINVHIVLNTVRCFYQDLARWAADDPARWGPWVVPSPVRVNETSHVKARSRRKADMDQRTRTQLPVLPTLVATVEQERRDAVRRLAAGRGIPAGTEFVLDGQTYLRRGGGSTGCVYIQNVDTGHRIDLASEETRVFWSWAIVEVLRLTGIRHEEMLELTHHSFVAYTLPTTGEIVPMLQVAPSKIDMERLLLVSPELGEVLTAIIHRVRAGKAAMPLVSAYDTMERTWSAPMPFLFQRRHGPEQRSISRKYVQKALDQAVEASGLTDVAGQPLRFTPHDFRRLFLTDAIRSGLPPHIAAKIAGHQVLDTTMGYAAIYPEDVISHHRAFIARRRSLRPSEEYRDITPEEWQEFLGHFELRKVALGICTRDFGTPCAHEHACVRCPQLLPDPAQMPRLQEIHTNLLDRLNEANEQGWLGEVAAIQASLAAAEQKLTSMQQLAAKHTTVHLGMPDFRPDAGRSSPDS
ncbi:tyrosine-type recombinase/integrase [Nonomuraea cypriaca]|nr:site-specific integrase [Nonomuraea cypriaca]